MVGFKWATAAAAVVAAASAAPGKAKKVPGKAFDRIAIVYFENTDFDKAIGDRMSSNESMLETRPLT